MQEHAEGPRSNTLKVCSTCGATIARDADVCPKCNHEQEPMPPKPGPGH